MSKQKIMDLLLAVVAAIVTVAETIRSKDSETEIK